MMRIALDTNRYVDVARGDDALKDLLERADAVVLPFVVIAELRAGFAVGSRGKENEAALQKFLSTDGISIAFGTEATTHHYARLYRQLREQGTPIPTNDLWIAALVVEHNLQLCTRDSHFDALPQLPVVTP